MPGKLLFEETPIRLGKATDDIVQSVRKGLFHIVGANVLNNVIAFSISFVLVRLLTKAEFGQFSYAKNIINMLYIIGGLGIESGIIQFCTRADDSGKRASYFRFGVRIEILFGLFLGFGILVFTRFAKLPVEGSTHLLCLMAFLPLFYHFFTAGMQYQRSLLWNRPYAYVNVVNSVLMLVFAISGAWLFAVEGAALFSNLPFIISAIIAFRIIWSELRTKPDNKPLNRKDKRGFLGYSVTAMLTNSVSQILYVIDTFLIGLFISNPETVATYKIATVIPFALNFIPKSLITFIFPYLIKKQDNSLRNLLKRMQLYLGVLNIAIFIFLFTLAPYIIRILFGAQYGDAVLPFRILSFGYVISGTFRIPYGNTIASQLKIKYNLVVGTATMVLHILLDIWLINKMGMIGASIATVSAISFSVLLSAYFLFGRVLNQPGVK